MCKLCLLVQPPYAYPCSHVLEVFPYSSLESVNEEEPVTGDTLIFNLGIRVSNLSRSYIKLEYCFVTASLCLKSASEG